MMEMIRISKNCCLWTDVWIPSGCFNIYKKKYERQGYVVKKTIIKKERRNVL